MFVKYYKDNIGNKQEVDRAKYKLITILLSDKKYGSDKIEDIDDTDMESKLKDVFVPGLFSTFIYKSESDIVNGVSFGDYMPIILCCKKEGRAVEGLNLNMIPNEHRAVFLDVLDKAYSNFLSIKGKNDALNNKVSICNEMGDMLLDENKRIQLFKLFETKSGCNISRAYRRYKISHINFPRLIEYSSLKYIPLLSFEGSIRDANILKIQEATIANN